MNLWRVAYNIAILPAGRAAVRLAALRNPKVADALAGRRYTFTQMENNLSKQSGSKSESKGIWFHASSVGEYLQAVPLIKRLKAAQSERPIYLSFSSPSVEKPARSFKEADLAFYLPEDTPANVSHLLDLLKPGLLIFSKFDIWPNLVWLANETGVPVAVTAATLSPDSGRLRQPAGSFHRGFYKDLSLVCAISEEDAASYQKLGVNSSNCLVTGDTRFDQTFERASGIDDKHPGVAAFNGWKTGVRLVCGSIWPADPQRVQ